jgi:hypothetical protein
MSVAGTRVRLESIKVPGGSFTSEEAIARFIAALNCADGTTPSPSKRSNQTDRALAELRNAGIH